MTSKKGPKKPPQKPEPEDDGHISHGAIAWMAGHPVAANLLMLVCIFGGLYLLNSTTKEVFPEFALDTVSVSVSYPGASPEEVEQGIVLALEDAVNDVEGIGEVTSRAGEGSASLTAEVLDSDEVMRVSQDIKTAVDRINSFPDDAEDVTVTIDSRQREVLSVAVYGDVGNRTLREAAEMIRDILDQDKDIGGVEMEDARDLEIHIEIPQARLRRYDLSLQDVSAIIRNTALELGGGALDTPAGEVLVRMTERRDYARQFADIPLITLANGSQVRLGDVAEISEGFEDSDRFAYFDGKPALLLDVYRTGGQTPVGVSRVVHERLDELRAGLPGGIELAIRNDRSDLFEQRAALLMKNGVIGLILVICFLSVFLDMRLAFWVSMGIPISFLGAFLLFPFTGATINIISMFAFLIALGIVVDDAIVVGENIYHYRQKGLKPLRAAIVGASEMASPVTVSILTNIVAFVPLMFVPGQMGKVFSIIPVVVISTFVLSLLESLFVLPAHLRFGQRPRGGTGLRARVARLQDGFSGRFRGFVENGYAPFLERVIRGRYVVAALFLTVLVISAAYVKSGRMGMTLFPRVESDYAYVSATLKVGAPFSTIAAVHNRLVGAAEELVAENGGDALSEGIFSRVNENSLSVRIYLTEPDVRPVTTKDLTQMWRERVGEIPGLENISFQSNRGGPGSGAALTVELSHRDTDVLDRASVFLAEALAEFPNTKDIDDGSAQGKKQFDFKMKPLGYTLGLTTESVARQVRAAFYGIQTIRQQRGRNEVTVMVRLPEDERIREYNLMNLMLRAPDGTEVLLRDVVTMEEGRAYTTINRRNGRRIVNVTADVDPPSQAGQVLAALERDTFPELVRRYPGLTYGFEGRQADIRESVTSLMYGLVAILFVIYAILAVLFSSYGQPLMVLIAIPFSAIGAMIGHLIMGYSLSVMSLFGLLALAGVVVNDSLILVDYANRKRRGGDNMHDALLKAGMQRFRPIVLTTATTFFGLAPMILETSRQARFLVPMALSLGFGIVFATMITLILVPALYMMIEDLRALMRKLHPAR